MRSYTVHLKEGQPLDGAGLIFVREGFSWGAFLVPVIWFLWHRLWIPFALSLAFFVCLGLFTEHLGSPLSVVVISQVVVALLFGFHAQDIRRWSLSLKGFRLVGLASGSDLAEAEQSFIQNDWEYLWLGTQTTPAKPEAGTGPLPSSSLSRSGG